MAEHKFENQEYSTSKIFSFSSRHQNSTASSNTINFSIYKIFPKRNLLAETLNKKWTPKLLRNTSLEIKRTLL